MLAHNNIERVGVGAIQHCVTRERKWSLRSPQILAARVPGDAQDLLLRVIVPAKLAPFPRHLEFRLHAPHHLFSVCMVAHGCLLASMIKCSFSPVLLCLCCDCWACLCQLASPICLLVMRREGGVKQERPRVSAMLCAITRVPLPSSKCSVCVCIAATSSPSPTSPLPM